MATGVLGRDPRLTDRSGMLWTSIWRAITTPRQPSISRPGISGKRWAAGPRRWAARPTADAVDLLDPRWQPEDMRARVADHRAAIAATRSRSAPALARPGLDAERIRVALDGRRGRVFPRRRQRRAEPGQALRCSTCCLPGWISCSKPCASWRGNAVPASALQRTDRWTNWCSKTATSCT